LPVLENIRFSIDKPINIDKNDHPLYKCNLKFKVLLGIIFVQYGDLEKAFLVIFAEFAVGLVKGPDYWPMFGQRDREIGKTKTANVHKIARNKSIVVI
jgi:hypothetical protein